jgi:glutathione reductase (NADPH)
MPKFDLDLFVIGAGSGGVRAARMAAAYGARVAIADTNPPGGTCVNAGCIPKKLFYYSAAFAAAFNDARGFGWEPGIASFDWQKLLQNKDREIERLNGIYTNLLLDAGVELLTGKAVLTGPQTVMINNRAITAERILVATGSYAVLPDIPGREFCISSNEVFHLPALPARIIIVGGGYIALEFAAIFHGLGVDTTVVHRGELPLGGFDHDIRTACVEELQKKGIRLRLNDTVTRVEREGPHYRTVYQDNTTDTADQVMFATGRKPNTSGLGLDTVGVKLDDNGAIITDNWHRTNINAIYAIGDVAGRFQLTPVAIAEAMALTRTIYGNSPVETDYTNIPTCVFSQPDIACVGLTEQQARAQFKNIAIYLTRFRPLKHTLTGKNEKVLIKLVVNRDDDRVLGAHMLGMDAGEIIQGIAIAIKAGATKSQFDNTVGIHPTAAEEFVTLRKPVAEAP